MSSARDTDHVAEAEEEKQKPKKGGERKESFCHNW